MKNKKIVTIGGGSGQFVLLSGLRDMEGVDITAVVSMIDSGGSTGRLRDELGILPPGDILKCILALSPYRDTLRNILLKRFTVNKRLRGHNAGNMLLTMLSQYAGSFSDGAQSFAEILDVKGVILPVSVDKATLVADLSDGSRIYGEKAIDVPEILNRGEITNLFLVPHHHDSISVHPPVIQAINEADYIIIGPGDFYTSIVPNFLVSGVKEAIKESRATLVYIVNIMTKFGETDRFDGYDFVKRLEDFLEMHLDKIVFNTEKPDDGILQEYKKQKSEFVEFDMKDGRLKEYGMHSADMLTYSDGIVRHNSKKLSSLIQEIIT